MDQVNVFSVDINQDEGAVDFLLQNGLVAQYLVLDSFTTKVTGCTASAVKVVPVWYDSEFVDGPAVQRGRANHDHGSWGS